MRITRGVSGLIKMCGLALGCNGLGRIDFPADGFLIAAVICFLSGSLISFFCDICE